MPKRETMTEYERWKEMKYETIDETKYYFSIHKPLEYDCIIRLLIIKKEEPYFYNNYLSEHEKFCIIYQYIATKPGPVRTAFWNWLDPNRKLKKYKIKERIKHQSQTYDNAQSVVYDRKVPS